MELYEDFLKQENEEFGSDTNRKSRKTYDHDPKRKESMSPSSIAHASEKNALHKERSRVDQEIKRHERSGPSWETEPGRSHMKHEDQDRIEHLRWRRKSEYDRRDGKSSHRDRRSKKVLSTVRESHDRSNDSKRSHSHRRKHHRDKRRHRSHSSSGSSISNDAEDFHHKRKRSRDVEVNILQRRDVSYHDTIASGHKDISLKHGSKTKEKSTTSLCKEDRKYCTKYDKSRDVESWYKLKRDGKYDFSGSCGEGGRTVCEVDNHYRKASVRCDSEGRDTKTRRQLAAHSHVRKYSWERRNSDSSYDDSGSESHRYDVKYERNTGRTIEGMKKHHHTTCL
jgi:hypothetical protein